MSSDGTTIFDDVHVANFHTLGWSKATSGDFDQLVSHGFFRLVGYDRHGRPSRYTLDDMLIIEAVESDFQLPDPVPPVATQFNIHNNTFAGISNIGSVLNSSTQLISDASHLPRDFKAEFNQLLNGLFEVLEQVDDTHKRLAQRVAKQAERLAEDVAQEEPDDETVKITAEGLKAAATNLAKVVPIVLPIALQLVEFVQRLPK